MIAICLALLFLHFANGCTSHPRNFQMVVDTAAFSASEQLRELGTYRNRIYLQPSCWGWDVGFTLDVMKELCLHQYRRIPRTYEVSGSLMGCTFGLTSGNTTDAKAELLLEEMNDYVSGAIFKVEGVCRNHNRALANLMIQGDRRSMDVLATTFIAKMMERYDIEFKCRFIIKKPYREGKLN